MVIGNLSRSDNSGATPIITMLIASSRPTYCQNGRFMHEILFNGISSIREKLSKHKIIQTSKMNITIGISFNGIS